ncbi:MAG: hypothetical protein LBS99_03620 [Clostridiales bacterium]|jgi:hypothetical protein|nr:hypothetical protein [Clostridiales bacterium]
MNEQRQNSAPQNFGAATRNRHDRETLTALGKSAGVSRETLRKVEKIDKTAPAVLRKVMGKTISFHKAYEFNQRLQSMPEEEREVWAVWLIQKEIEDKASGVFREKRIAAKLADIMTAAQRNGKCLTEEAVDLYLQHTTDDISDIIGSVGEEIRLLCKLRQMFLSRKAMG